MADNFLEYHHEEYERRKAEWLRKKKFRTHTSRLKSSYIKRQLERPDDEAL